MKQLLNFPMQRGCLEKRVACKLLMSIWSIYSLLLQPYSVWCDRLEQYYEFKTNVAIGNKPYSNSLPNELIGTILFEQLEPDPFMRDWMPNAGKHNIPGIANDFVAAQTPWHTHFQSQIPFRG